MPEYIEREAATELVDRLKYYAHEYCTGGNLGREIEGTDELLFEAVDTIEALSAADVVEVVCCKDCLSGEVDDPDFPDQYYCCEGCGWNAGDFYCAYGARRDNDG